MPIVRIEHSVPSSRNGSRRSIAIPRTERVRDRDSFRSTTREVKHSNLDDYESDQEGYEDADAASKKAEAVLQAKAGASETESLKTEVAADEITNYKSGFTPWMIRTGWVLTVLTAFNMIGDSFGKLMPLSGFLSKSSIGLGSLRTKPFTTAFSSSLVRCCM
jgi:hypothetical protein